MIYHVQVGSQHDMIVNVWDWKNNIKASHDIVLRPAPAISYQTPPQKALNIRRRKRNES